MRRYPRRLLSRRPNALRKTPASPTDSAEAARSLEQARKLHSELPAIIDSHVGEKLQKLESKLLREFEDIGQKVAEESANILHEQLNERIETLEEVSAIQTTALNHLRDSSRVAEEKVSTVVNTIERTLSSAVPGFQLEPSAYRQQLIETASTELVKTEPNEIEARGKYGFCPYCTSTNIRRANRSGLWEECLRLFFLAPFRCRACRKKFYKF